MKRTQLSSIRIVQIKAVFTVVLLVTCGRKASADFIFGEAVNLGRMVNSASVEASTSTSADHLELYFSSNRPGGFGDLDIWVATRQNISAPWEPPVNLGAAVNTPHVEAYPSLSADGLTLYFSDLYSGTPRPGGLGGADIWMTIRASRNDAWATPVNVGAPINSSAMDVSPTVSGDGLMLIFASSRAGTGGPYDLWLSQRATAYDPWGPPVNLGATVNSTAYGDLECSLSADGLALFFASGRPGGLSNYDLWMTTRESREAPWTATVNLGAVVNSTSTEGAAGLSADMRTLYFDSDRPGGSGGYDLWAAPITPVVDFNGDGTVATDDLVRLIQSWGKEDPLADIGPGPWGDGKVDAADLEVLMGYWGQEVPDSTLDAHWKFDETEGQVAFDNAAAHNGTILGVPARQPSAGVVDGALEFNGMTFVVADLVLNPSDGPFSVLAWIKGGAPGQVVLSQTGAANWLCTDSAEGCLMTELKDSGRSGVPLSSLTTITDVAWHRIGFVLDGSCRHLYVDGVEVANDTTPLSRLGSAHGGLYFGVGSTLSPHTFWSGLIDDVRIYNIDKDLGAAFVQPLDQVGDPVLVLPAGMHDQRKRPRVGNDGHHFVGFADYLFDFALGIGNGFLNELVQHLRQLLRVLVFQRKDEDQEIYYPAVMRAIVETGFDGYVAHEYTPTRDPVESLVQAVKACDV